MEIPDQEILSVFYNIFISADLNIETFYHYTTIDALVNGITKEDAETGKEICLRATHCRFVNDSEEIKKGAQLISILLEQQDNTKTRKEHFDELMKQYENMFLLSFSENEDSLPMWNAYSNNSTGVAIGFNRIQSLSKNDVALKCWYNTKELAKELKYYQHSEKYEIVSYALMKHMPQMLKNAAFEYEKEIRLIGDFKSSRVKFREKNGYIIPYKEVFFAKEQVKTITLGPCQYPENAKFSLRQLLDSRGFEHVKIIQSNIPFRNI